MARTASKMAQKGQKWHKMVNFQKYSNACGVGTLNMSQEMSDKMQNESGQFDYTLWENAKNVVQMDHFCGFSDILEVFLWMERSYWYDSTSLENQQAVVWLQ